jgi:NAD(P)-dependent dehydrogenase (short-subunit alcohol dehydrogenase family)
MDQIQGKVVVITGGSDGIGKALVELYLNKGAKVATCARNYEKLYQLLSIAVG